MALIEFNHKQVKKNGRLFYYALVTCDCPSHEGPRERIINRNNNAGFSFCYKCASKFKKTKKTEEDYEKLAHSLGIEFIGPFPESTECITNWRCKCGDEFSRTYHRLRGQQSILCDRCARSDGPSKNFKGYKEISLTQWNRAKKCAREGGRLFDINIEQAYEIFLKQNKKCAISGLDIGFGVPGKKYRSNVTASLDRIDSDKNYTLDNVQWVHKDINWMKQDFNEEYFIKTCKKIAFNNKKTWVITGALGYIGFEICRYFKDTTDIVIAIDNNFIPDRVKDLTEWGIEYHHIDLFNMKEYLRNADYCIHCASITEVPSVASQATEEKDNKIINVGVHGTKEIIKYTPEKCKIIFLSTHCIFEGLNEEVLNIDEKFEPKPVLAYAKSKYQSELDLFDSNKQFIVTRLASVYGLPASRWKIVANLFAKMTAIDGKIKIFGGDCIKPLVGILDVARCLIFLAKSKYNREIFNIVNENLKVRDIANICKEFSYKLQLEEIKEETLNVGYSLNNEKILKTGFKFEQNITDEIRKMIRAWRNK